MSGIQDLTSSITKLDKQIHTLGTNINTLSSVSATKPKYALMTKRQIAKRIIMMGGDIMGSIPIPNPPTPPPLPGGVPSPPKPNLQMDEKTAHLTVYGKFLYGPDGKLIDNEELFPDCVAKPGEGMSGVNNMPDSSPMLRDIEDMKEEFEKSINGLLLKVGEIGHAAGDMMIQLILAITSLAAAATILPPGSGVPVAVSAIKSIPAAFMTFQTRLIQIIPLLKPLRYANVLLDDSSAGPVISSINTMLNVFSTPLGIINNALSPVAALAGGGGAIPPVPGVDAPAEPVVLDPKAEPNIITTNVGKTIKLKANASKGSWQYTYKWYSDPVGFSAYSENDDVTVDMLPPLETTRYYVEVTDINSGGVTYGETVVNVNLS